MADTFKKLGASIPPDFDEVIEWKNIQVEKEHQPEKQKTVISYHNMERQLEDININITSLTEQKAILEGEMVKVKAIAEA